MSEQGRKRKLLQDLPVDLSKMRMAMESLDALKQELNGIKETKHEMDSISQHVIALEEILKRAKKSKITFSTVKLDNLKNTGVIRKPLSFDPAVINQHVKTLNTNAAADTEIKDLHLRLKKIYARVNMDYEAGSRMILHKILLSSAEIVPLEGRFVAILPGMKLGGEDVLVADFGYELLPDYAIIEYENVRDYKARLLAPGGSRDDAFKISKGPIFLFEAQRGQSLPSQIPKAVSQAIALLRSAKFPEIRFCLSDGQYWMFFILRDENGKLTYYESVPRCLRRDAAETDDMLLREIVLLVCEWLKPTVADLFVRIEGMRGYLDHKCAASDKSA